MLAWIECAPVPVVEMRLGDVKGDAIQRCLLRRQHCVGKPHQLLCDVECPLMGFQLFVIGFAALLDGKTQQDQTGLTQGLGEGFFG